MEGLQTTLSEVRQYLSKLKEPVFDAQPLSACAAEIDHARRSLSQLNLTEVDDLEKELKKLEGQIEQHERDMQSAHTEAARANDRVKTAESAISDINARRDSRFAERERQIQRLKLLCEANPEKTYTVMAEEVEDLLTARAIDIADTLHKLTTLRAAPGNLLVADEHRA